MRTTLDLPEVLGRRTKFAAARRGISMKALIVLALEHELDSKGSASQAQPLEFPLVRSRTPGAYELNPEQIGEILVREEAAAYEASDRR